MSNKIPYNFTDDYKIIKTKDSSIKMSSINNISLSPSSFNKFLKISTVLISIIYLAFFEISGVVILASIIFFIPMIYLISNQFYKININNDTLILNCHYVDGERLKRVIEYCISNENINIDIKKIKSLEESSVNEFERIW